MWNVYATFCSVLKNYYPNELVHPSVHQPLHSTFDIHPYFHTHHTPFYNPHTPLPNPPSTPFSLQKVQIRSVETNPPLVFPTPPSKTQFTTPLINLSPEKSPPFYHWGRRFNWEKYWGCGGVQNKIKLSQVNSVSLFWWYVTIGGNFEYSACIKFHN